ncbi:hypothetical protein PR003_g13481 [Phytophthora rubi]|uniref:Uncharacterized protein n=1 Tax=Phytophthora rubi TaxID=129364 RepID=A0A6A3L1B8_9STRA|nr:hypothetical protein PR002_g15007 [Phytophthora rubi]KAE9028581.1 hypothetical protein PR001_g11699 [Phytophthora rubi]KAE9334512.1 hypothetical protein PR003_g13481 [Phytophthora rubi]
MARLALMICLSAETGQFCLSPDPCTVLQSPLPNWPFLAPSRPIVTDVAMVASVVLPSLSEKKLFRSLRQ